MVNINEMQPIETIIDQVCDDDLSIAAFAKEAIEFIKNQEWCKTILKGYLALGFEGILGVFFFEIETKSENVDKYLWVIVGDIPPAYLVIDNCPNAPSALDVYIYEMGLWIDAVKKKKTLDDIIPVNVPPTIKYAKMLEKRLEFIKNEILKNYSNEIKC